MSKAINQASLDWMPKEIWGPIKWKELHSRALAYLPMKGESEWLKSFVSSIPCPDCQHHFTSFIRQHPPVFDTRPDFFRWTVDAHNFVNRALERSEVSYEEALIINSEQWK